MNNEQLANQKQHWLNSGTFIGLGVGIIIASLLWYLLSPSSLFTAILFTGGIIAAIGIALQFLPGSSSTLDQRELDRITVEEFIREWRDEESGTQPWGKIDY